MKYPSETHFPVTIQHRVRLALAACQPWTPANLACQPLLSAYLDCQTRMHIVRPPTQGSPFANAWCTDCKLRVRVVRKRIIRIVRSLAQRVNWSIATPLHGTHIAYSDAQRSLRFLTPSAHNMYSSAHRSDDVLWHIALRQCTLARGAQILHTLVRHSDNVF